MCVRYIHALVAVCLNSVVFVRRSGPPAAGVGLREKCRLGAVLLPRASLFSAFLRTLALSSRAIMFVIVIFWLAVHFHVLLRAGPACAGSAPRSPLCGLLLCEPRAVCMSAGLGGAYFLFSFSVIKGPLGWYNVNARGLVCHQRAASCTDFSINARWLQVAIFFSSILALCSENRKTPQGQLTALVRQVVPTCPFTDAQ